MKCQNQFNLVAQWLQATAFRCLWLWAGYQSVLADNEQALGAVNLGQSDFFIESAVASHHHGDAIWEASLRNVRGRAQDRCCQVIDLKTGLQDKMFAMLTRAGGCCSTLNMTKKQLPCQWHSIYWMFISQQAGCYCSWLTALLRSWGRRAHCELKNMQ